jgi:hypothetical protein
LEDALVRWSDIPFHPSKTTLRQFAVLCVVIFGGMAGWQWFHNENRIAGSIFTVAAAIGLWGCWRPADLRPIFVGWMVLAFPIGWTVSLVVLAVLFFGVFTPLALVFRLSGRDYLRLRREPDADSYWEPLTLNRDPKSYLNQF